MKEILKVLALAIIATLCFHTSHVLADQESQAIDAAAPYLNLLDNGNIDGAYESMATIHKRTWIKEWWVKQNEAQREFYGQLINRSIRKTSKHDTIQRHPDGEYFKIQYESSFQNKQKAYETIDLMLDSAGHWKVTGYYCN